MKAYIQYSHQAFISGYLVELSSGRPLWSTEREDAAIMAEDEARQIFDNLIERWGNIELVLFMPKEGE